MKIKVTLVFCLVTSILFKKVYSQDIVTFEDMFDQVSLTDAMLNITTNRQDDFLNNVEIPSDLYNSIFLNGNPYYIDLNGKSVDINYIEQQDNVGVKYLEYDDDGNELASDTFYKKIVPIGKIDLLDNFNCFIVAFRHADILEIHLYNFDNGGNLVSAIRLLEAQASRFDIYYEHTSYDFKIEPDGKIFQKYNGLDFYRERKYELQPDGYFKVVWENVIDR